MKMASDLYGKLPSVAILTVTRDRCELLKQVLSQVRHLDYPQDKLGIFIVNGASTDGTLEMLKEHFADAHVVSTEGRKQIAAAENIGIREILNSEKIYKYIWFMDDDAELEPQTLKPLVMESEKDPKIAVIGSAVYDPDNPDKLVTAGFRLIWNRAGLAYNLPDSSDNGRLEDVEIIAACSSLTRTDIFKKIGLWDERFWLFWPDNDWCLRALRNGYRVCCSKESRIWHRSWMHTGHNFFTPYSYHSGVSGALLFYHRHSPLKSKMGIRKYILKVYLKAAFELFAVRPNYSRSLEEGVRDFLKGETSMKDFSGWFDVSNLSSMDAACSELSKELPDNPMIILNHIDGEDKMSEIKSIFSRYFDRIRWQQIPLTEKAKNLDSTKPLKQYLSYYFPRFILRLLMFHKRADLIVSPVCNPYLYNISSARHTMLFDNELRTYVTKNRLFKTFIKFFVIVYRSFKAVLFDLNTAEKKNKVFNEAAKGSSPLPHQSPSGFVGNKTKIV